ncbi:MAG TPA: cytochrome c biogenesis protein ResB [Microbacterium sp.]|uniref:cytochrome c biogenesis protein ResB n=1 Tax=Microbacterium sp. TaxID=51671 RepID=UPI002BC3D5A2|nr:cytochrome c biogenesis protein ResB [Microbacterium sp.]HWI30480.1 cytochrome c biogenesis protein ResB [Microbacterium sp.]
MRPSDHLDGGDIAQPALGPIGWMRWAWRQLTSMRTALVLLLLLAIAAVPGSIVPQRSADPNGVTQYYASNPDLAPVLDNLQLFDVYISAWFSAIYILLFVSLIGCVIPRTQHHWKALRARPPRTPARLARLDAYREDLIELAGADTEHTRSLSAAAASAAVDRATKQLRSSGYRVERYDSRGAFSVSAERGYLRETGNLLFHVALIGVLVSVGLGGGFAYTGQRVIVEGTTFVNTLLDYSSMNKGRFVAEGALPPYAMTLDSFDVTYQPSGSTAAGQAGDFSANVTVRMPGGETSEGSVRVNHPLDIAGDKIYLLGNGYAPTIVIRNAEGEVVFDESVPFLPQDTKMTSLGVVKVPDGMPEQLGMVGFFYPTQAALESGAFASAYPDLVNPSLTLNVYKGDLGIDDGTPRSVYALDTEDMTQLTGGKTGVDSIELAPGQTADLPDGLGTITFVDETPEGAAPGYGESVKRFASLQVHRDASGVWVLAFAVLALLGLLTALFVPRRRLWVKATPEGSVVRIEYAGLARGEDPTLGAAVEQFATRHRADGPENPRVD